MIINSFKTSKWGETQKVDQVLDFVKYWFAADLDTKLWIWSKIVKNMYFSRWGEKWAQYKWVDVSRY